MNFSEQRPAFWPLLIAGALAIIGIANLPIGYYEFLRWALTAASIFLAVISWRLDQKAWLVVAIPIFIFWFPPFRIFMDKSAWVVLDIIAGAALILAGVALTKQPKE